MSDHARRGKANPSKAAMPWVVGVLSMVTFGLVATANTAQAALITAEGHNYRVGQDEFDLVVIDDPTSANDGLSFFHMEFSTGKTKVAAVQAAVGAGYTAARVALPNE